jgi:uncharacterized membrane protein YjgN (DUF898 family)
MDNNKPLQFNGTAGGYFVVFLVTLVLTYIPLLGWAYLLNFTCGWLADNTTVNGKKVVFKAGYGESLMFVFINSLLLLITLGIYSFWFVPKMYRYFTDHVSYDDGTSLSPTPVVPVAPIPPVNPTPPAAPTPPTTLPIQ